MLGALVIAFSGILVRLADVSPSTAALFRCAYALPLLALLASYEQRRYGDRSWRDRRLAWAAGLFFAADLTFWHHSIEAVGAGLATVLANVQVVLVGLIAWAWLGERPERRSLTAIPVVFDGRPIGLASGSVEVMFASRRGPNAADDDIASIVQRDDEPGGLSVVTSDGDLAGRVRAAGAAVVGAGEFRRRLDEG